ncbi:MAG: MarR family transcriptional regulator [Reinekea sp.]
MTDKYLKLENQICHSLYSATNALIRAYRPLLDDLDLTYPQYLIMLALWESDSVAIKNLVQRTRLDAGTLTPILKRLQVKGIVDIRKSKEDSRQKVVIVTDQGRQLADQAASVPEALFCQFDLTLEEGRVLKTLSEKLYSGLRKALKD